MSRKGVWAGVAVLCLAAGTAGSVLQAQNVQRRDAAKARAAFQQTSTGIASTLKLALQREEDLAVSVSTFFAGHPKASRAEFTAWAYWAHALRRYPELERLNLVALVRAPELAAFETRVTGHAVKAPAPQLGKPSASFRTSSAGAGKLSTSLALPSVDGFKIVPPGVRPQYCFSVAGLARRPANTPAGQDYCAASPGLLSSRDSGLSSVTVQSARTTDALRVLAPVYTDGVPPLTLAGRRQAFVGWLRETLVPTVVLRAALQGRADSAVRLRYQTSSANVAFMSGTQPSGGQSTAINLHNGWSARIFGAPAGRGMLADGDSLAWLIGGILLSALAAVLMFILGGGRAPAAPSAPSAPKPRELPHEDLYDALTGLPNRGLSLDLAGRMVARSGRQAGMLAGALFVNLDWFGDVNQKLGQAAGDQLLNVVADRLSKVVRTGDTVGRVGGDQFVILVECTARGVRLDALAERVIESLHQPVDLDDFGPSFFVTASIGVAFGRYSGADDLLRDAQLALDAAKAAGKDRYTLFNGNMRSVIEGSGVLEAELNAALQDKQFFLLYQPIYDLRTRRVAGMEALIRWRHPTQGVLLPDNFLPLAEETGLIVPIGRWVLEEACSRAAAWNVAGHRVGVSATVSPNQLNRDGFATDVRRALQQSGVEAAMLTLEIAESTVMLDAAAAATRFDEVKRLGVRIAIDDFGSGYAYRSDLQKMPLDFLKVDRSSLAASDDEDYRSWLLEAILLFGRELAVTVIAKGIDTHEHMAKVQAMGCTMAQGYFLGDPTAGNALESVFNAEFPSAQGVPAVQAESGEQAVQSAQTSPSMQANPATQAGLATQPGPPTQAGPATQAPPQRPFQ